MTTRLKNGLAAVVAVAGLLTMIGCAKTKAAGNPAPPEVEVAVVAQKDLPTVREWIGTLDGMVNAAIKAQVTGYLLTQNYAEGSFVHKGQLLFEIDPRPLQAAYDQAMGQLAQAQGPTGAGQNRAVAGAGAASERRSQPEARRNWTRTATFRSPSSKPSRSRIWTTPGRATVRCRRRWRLRRHRWRLQRRRSRRPRPE